MNNIFQIMGSEDIIILFKQDQISDLCNLLKNNNINCKEEDFESYFWVKINDHSVREFANFGPFNQNCPIIKYSELIDKLNNNQNI